MRDSILMTTVQPDESHHIKKLLKIPEIYLGTYLVIDKGISFDCRIHVEFIRRKARLHIQYSLSELNSELDIDETDLAEDFVFTDRVQELVFTVLKINCNEFCEEGSSFSASEFILELPNSVCGHLRRLDVLSRFPLSGSIQL
jgi:hypothetical protein